MDVTVVAFYVDCCIQYDPSFALLRFDGNLITSQVHGHSTASFSSDNRQIEAVTWTVVEDDGLALPLDC